MAEPARIEIGFHRLEDAEIAEPERAGHSLPRPQRRQVFFQCALAGTADYIVSEDKDILAVCTRTRAPDSVSAAEFLSVILPSDE